MAGNRACEKREIPLGIGLGYAGPRIFLPTVLPLCVAHLMARSARGLFENPSGATTRRVIPPPARPIHQPRPTLSRRRSLLGCQGSSTSVALPTGLENLPPL